jgi:predicted MFS family arabinose efflux permease
MKFSEFRATWLLSANEKRFLSATGISALGDGLLVTAIPLLARSAATNRPFLVAAVFAAGRVPGIAGLAIGAFADRYDARKVMIATDIARAVWLMAVMSWFVTADYTLPIWALTITAVGLSVGQILFFAASQRAIPHIASPETLEQTNGAIQAVTYFGEQFAGPQIGVLVLTGGVVPLLGDAASFVGSALFLRRLPAIVASPRTTTLRTEIADGWNWFRQNELVRFVTEIVTAISFITTGIVATEIVLIRDTLQLPVWVFGAFTVVLAGGAIVGSLLAPMAIERLGPATTPAAILITGISYLACIGSRSPIVVFVAITIQQVVTLAAIIHTVTIRQRAIPPNLRGRVMGLSRSFIFGSATLGALSGGWIAENYGTDRLFAAAGLAAAVLGLVTSRKLRRLLGG